MGAGTHKDKVFVLDLNMAVLLSRLESCANEAKITDLIPTWSLTLSHYLSLKTSKKVKMGK